MEITVKTIGSEYKEMSVNNGHGRLESGTLTEDEAYSLAVDLVNAAYDLLDKDHFFAKRILSILE